MQAYDARDLGGGQMPAAVAHDGGARECGSGFQDQIGGDDIVAAWTGLASNFAIADFGNPAQDTRDLLRVDLDAAGIDPGLDASSQEQTSGFVEPATIAGTQELALTECAGRFGIIHVAEHDAGSANRDFPE